MQAQPEPQIPATTTPVPASDRVPDQPTMNEVAAAVDEAKAAEPKRRPKRDLRLFDDKQGDFRIYEIVQVAQGTGVPAGTLVPIPGIKGCQDTKELRKMLQMNSKLLVGKQVMLLRAIEISRIEVSTEPQIKVSFKPKAVVNGGA